MKKNSYNYDDLIRCGNGELFGPGNAKLPLPPMLMFDRITEINENSGSFNKGSLKAFKDPLLKEPLFSLISVILSNISIGGRGNLAFPGPKSSPFPHLMRSS